MQTDYSAPQERGEGTGHRRTHRNLFEVIRCPWNDPKLCNSIVHEGSDQKLDKFGGHRESQAGKRTCPKPITIL